MVKLNREQRLALKRVYDRTPLFFQTSDTAKLSQIGRPMTYREFRKTVQPCFGDAAVMVPWCGMWLGIETDGYTHS